MTTACDGEACVEPDCRAGVAACSRGVVGESNEAMGIGVGPAICTLVEMKAGGVATVCRADVGSWDRGRFIHGFHVNAPQSDDNSAEVMEEFVTDDAALLVRALSDALVVQEMSFVVRYAGVAAAATETSVC